MAKTNYIKSISKLGYPIVLGNLGLVLMGIFDYAMVGKVGHIPLAAAGISNNLFFIVSIFGIGVLMITSALIAERLVEKKNQVNALSQAVMVVNLILSLVTFIILKVFVAKFHLFQQPLEVGVEAIPYFNILAWSIWPMFIYLAFKNIADGHSFTKASMIATITAVSINIFLNWVLIYGNLGFSALGLEGAGYATMFSRIYMAVFMLVYVFNKVEIQFSWTDLFQKIHWEEIKKILKNGIPSGLQFFFEVSAFAGAAIMAGWIGSIALAAHNIVISLASFTYMISAGISTASMILVGEQVGRNNWHEIKMLGKYSMYITLAFMTFFSVFFILGHNYLPTLFNSNSEVLQITSKLMLITAFFQLFDGVQAVSLGLLRGISDTKIPSFITLIIYWVLAIPLCYFLGIYLEWGPFGIWIGLTAGLILASFLLYYRFKSLTTTIINRNHE